MARRSMARVRQDREAAAARAAAAQGAQGAGAQGSEADPEVIVSTSDESDKSDEEAPGKDIKAKEISPHFIQI